MGKEIKEGAIQQVTRQPGLIIFLVFLCGICSACGVKTGEFFQADLLETKLIAGESKKADVLLILGEPSGTGGAVIPTDPEQQEIWYYENFEMPWMSMEQQILLVFFKQNIFDGYLWFSNNLKMKLK